MHTLIAKIEELIRVGMIPVAQLPILKRAITYLDQGMFMPTLERQVFYTFVSKFMGTSLNDPTLFRALKQKIITNRNMREHMDNMNEASTGVKQTASHSDDIKSRVAADIAARKAKRQAALDAASKEMASYVPDKKDKRKIFQKEEVEQLDELSKKTLGSYINKASNDKADRAFMSGNAYAKDGSKVSAYSRKEAKRGSGIAKAVSKLQMKNEEIELQKAPEGMLMNFANIVKSKVRAGGKPTDGDKKLASKAKNELRRRRNVASKRMAESVDYAERITLLLQQHNVSSIDELTQEQQAAFFAAI